MNLKEFAKIVGVAPNHLSEMLNGHKIPTFNWILDLEESTGGLVKPLPLCAYALDMHRDRRRKKQINEERQCQMKTET